MELQKAQSDIEVSVRQMTDLHPKDCQKNPTLSFACLNEQRKAPAEGDLATLTDHRWCRMQQMYAGTNGSNLITVSKLSPHVQ